MKKQIEDIALIVTGCISPNEKVFCLSLKNSNDRLIQYIESIEYYIEKTNIKKIIFCDNSNFYSKKVDELEILAKKYNKKFEYLTFKGNVKKCITQGKGYGEGEIIKYIYNNSLIFKSCKYFMKVTGRLKVTNIDLILRIIKKKNNYFDYTLHNKCDTRFYFISKSDYKEYFIDAYFNVNDKKKIYLEHVFRKILDKNDINYSLFPIMPKIVGISGSSGMKYKDSVIKYYIKYFLIKIGLYKYWRRHE